MEDLREKTEQLRELLSGGGKRIAIVTHTNPDGDAIGSALAWAEVLEEMGHTVKCMVPNRYPSFLEWMKGIDRMIVAKDSPVAVAEAIAEAEVVFIMDLNKIDRLESISECLSASSAKRVLVDHHLSPSDDYDIRFSYPTLCSTAYLTYNIIVGLFGTEAITKSIAENIYAGIMTDTGNFAFSFLTPDLMRAVAVLIEKGLDIQRVNTAIYCSYTEGRVRLLGYALCHKMSIIEHGKAAYMGLSEREMRRFGFQLGDSEGFVNYPLTIVGVKLSALFIETRKYIRVSLRSRGEEVDVNLFARRYFNGGGHKNAAGGKSFISLEQTFEYFKQSVAEFFKEE